MKRIRERFDAINLLRKEPPSWTVGETIGTHLRKIVEGVAFGCVIAIEHSVKNAPRNVMGQWNAETILLALKKSGEFPYPDPNKLRLATEDEVRDHNVKIVIEGVVEARVSVDELLEIYRRTHPWTHEDNPYVARPAGDKDFNILLKDVDRVEAMLRLHRIGIKGKSFVCTIRDAQDGQVKVQSIDQVQAL